MASVQTIVNSIESSQIRRNHRGLRPLNLFQSASELDSTIAEYNKTIKRIVTAYNRKSRDTEGPKVEYFLVDICDQLLRLAFKRNHGKPTYELPQEIIDLNMRLGRTVDTVSYTVDRTGRMSGGGVFSLDGVHPTAFGHGLIAGVPQGFREGEGANGKGTGFGTGSQPATASTPIRYR